MNVIQFNIKENLVNIIFLVYLEVATNLVITEPLLLATNEKVSSSGSARDDCCGKSDID